MIGRIQGNIIEKSVNRVLLDVGGLGYEVEIPLTTYYRLEGSGDAIVLHTHLVVRDDAHLLYGFYTLSDRDLFRELIKVNGVGPKLALTILSGMEAEGLGQCIRDNDVKALVALPGVGKKTAERLILDLRDKLPHLAGELASVVPLRANDNLADAESALIELGFKPQEAARALARVENADADVESLIRQALKALA